MSPSGWLQILLYLLVLIAFTKPLGIYMARVYEGERTLLSPVLGPLERWLYRLAGTLPEREMTWKQYAGALLLFNLFGILLLYGLERVQQWLPLNPEHVGAVGPPDLALNTAVSFGTNTNWQAYGGETTLSYFTQMAGLTVQNFVSAGTGMAALVALIRGFRRKSSERIGNFWVDLVRSNLYILLPLAVIGALLLVWQGVPQTLAPYQKASLVEPVRDSEGHLVREQAIAVGPVASQVIIKQLGTNGGGFFNANSAHPLENPTPLSNFVEMLSLLLIPAALTYTFGKMVGDTRQGWAIFAAMTVIFVAMLGVVYWQESAGNPALARLGVDQATAGGNMEGKEVRFGVAGSALWATATTAASNGSVNSMHDSYVPLGGFVPMFLMMLGEVVFGGVGSGLYGMLAFVIAAVFVAGLMVGRTPEYLGKKIEIFEMKMAALIILVVPLAVLVPTAIALMTPSGRAAVFNPGPHGFSEVLYAFASMGNNNGSAFGGLGVNTPVYNVLGSLAMLMARYWAVVPALALAGSLARKKIVPPGPGTLPTASPLFVAWLVAVVIVVGGLNFFPALALGPIVEHLIMAGS
ncbi:potassium-transporting ATPase subunit KdpA [Carboxydochorda subterranea]|uniref:Potassium-transporting ATPase potassium-binding subunit n=1 Tax=Carboxydichorda subterranea TaxID=3109565 RepID=A0ABZ1C3N2_9FIRM|nr:potassium-transporting ATPase subunit KdpA [Limnochorda sp. L945t]WRP18658.1 potassium-transporting ATPase subunit KdpA [Limnochorda sp. L945t]